MRRMLMKLTPAIVIRVFTYLLPNFQALQETYPIIIGLSFCSFVIRDITV